MIILDCSQGLPEWFEAKLGVVSASRFKDVMTQPRAIKDKKSGKLSATAQSYMYELIAEKMLDNHREIHAKALDWGNRNEPKARANYCFDCAEDVTEVGFILHDSRQIGASPDSLVGDKGGLEIKSPENPAIHLKTILRGEIPAEHIPQVQGNMWIAEREWWDFVSFRNDMPPHLRQFCVRVFRDDEYIDDLSGRVMAFAGRVQTEYLSLMEKSA